MLELEAAEAGCCNESKWMLLQDEGWMPASRTDLDAACRIVDRKRCDLQYIEQTWMLLQDQAWVPASGADLLHLNAQSGAAVSHHGLS